MVDRTRHFPTLTTPRLTLREVRPGDELDIFELRSDPEVNKYLGRQLATNIDDARNFITNVTDTTAAHHPLYWAVTITGNDNLIGTICLFDFSAENDQCEIGYELKTAYQNMGFMSEAIEKVIDYAFNTINMQKISAFFHSENSSSLKLLQKFAFVDATEPDRADAHMFSYHLLNRAQAGKF